MAKGHESRDRPAAREDADGDAPQAELRWVRLREPRHAVEIGRNGRILDRRYNAGRDVWEVLLETYEDEV